jgi:hypothetical protein
MVCVYLYGVIYCATWQGITWLYALEIYPLYLRSLCMALTIVDGRLWSYVVSRSTPYMISDIGYGSECLSCEEALATITDFNSLLLLRRFEGPALPITLDGHCEPLLFEVPHDDVDALVLFADLVLNGYLDVIKVDKNRTSAFCPLFWIFWT